MFNQKSYTSKAGNEYTFQHPGVRKVSKINDASKNKHGVVSEERLSEEVLKFIVVSPKMKIEDFKDYSEYSEVINAAYAFVTGQDEQEGEDDDQQEGSPEEG
ncbi:hypothetical protein MUG84_26515 [Paenibacillus sp. KQZ6P-2]|uniref:Phage tail assembly protein n=1 Tax=Paenibacillus mangrovi TaxID=2931978 RepID=A0A9X2B554_9BACL|nr:hypothetical protein [Paenibacillus mangrovi]MCJ8015226.1 hypothetical protein [Paenibacillus mangrovi]